MNKFERIKKEFLALRSPVGVFYCQYSTRATRTMTVGCRNRVFWPELGNMGYGTKIRITVSEVPSHTQLLREYVKERAAEMLSVLASENLWSVLETKKPNHTPRHQDYYLKKTKQA